MLFSIFQKLRQIFNTEAISIEEDYVQFYKKDKIGMQSSRGTVIPAIYDFVSPLSDGLFCVENKGKYAYFDTFGRIMLPFSNNYDTYDDFCEGLARVRLDNKWGFIDRTGTEVIAPQFFHAENFSDGFAIVRNEDALHGAIDTKGTLVIDYRFNYFAGFKNNYAVFGNHITYGLMNRTGDIVVPQEFINLKNITDNTVTVRIKEGDLYKEGILTIGGQIEWNNNMDAFNERIYQYNVYKEAITLLIQQLYVNGCPCSYKRFRNYIEWKEPLCFRDQELLFDVFAKFLKQFDTDSFECKTCGTVYTKRYTEYSIALIVSNVSIAKIGVYEDNGADVAKLIPVTLGILGHGTKKKLERDYFTTDSNTVINYLGQTVD